MNLKEALKNYIERDRGESIKYVLMDNPSLMFFIAVPEVVSSHGAVAEIPIEINFHIEEGDWTIDLEEPQASFIRDRNAQKLNEAKSMYFREVLSKINRKKRLNAVEQNIKEQYALLRKETAGKAIDYVYALDIPEELYIKEADLFDIDSLLQEVVDVLTVPELPAAYLKDPLSFIEDHIGELAKLVTNKEE